MFERAMVACRHCGYVELRHTYEEGAKRCPECRRPMEDIGLEEARELVRRRRAADRRRADEDKIAEVGLKRKPWPDAIE